MSKILSSVAKVFYLFGVEVSIILTIIKKDFMKHITLGRTGSTVSAISLGTWSYGGSATINKNISVGWSGQSDKNSIKALHKAYELGIIHWDTADVYGSGHSEKIIGSVWKDIPRHDVFLATKVGWHKGPFRHFYHPVHMRSQMESSLKNLNTDTLDLLYLHHCNFGDSKEYFDDAIETVRRFQEEGKTRFIGLSDWFSEKIMAFIKQVDPDVIQPYRNVMDDTYKSSGLKEWIENHNLGVCFFSPIKHGLLTGKYSKATSFESGDFRTTVKEFANQDLIDKLMKNKMCLESRFSYHTEPVLHGLVDALLTDVPTGCVLLGQRDTKQVEAAAQLGQVLSHEDYDWVKKLYQ